MVGKATSSKRVTKMGDTQVIMSIANGAALALGRWGFLPYQRRKVEEAGLPTQNGDTHLEAGLKEDFASSKLSQVSYYSFQGRAVWNTDGAKKKAAGAERSNWGRLIDEAARLCGLEMSGWRCDQHLLGNTFGFSRIGPRSFTGGGAQNRNTVTNKVDKSTCYGSSRAQTMSCW